jgi:hypothetical protein
MRFKIIIGLGSLLLFSSLCTAHTLGSATKNTEASISRFAVTCFDDGNGANDKYSVQIKYNSTLPVGLRLTVTKVGAGGGVTVDATRSGVFSPWIFNKGGNGPYQLTVTKIKQGDASALGRIPFTIEHHCTAANGAHTGTSDTVDISPPGQDDGNPTPPPVPPVTPVNPGQPPVGTPGFVGTLTSQFQTRTYQVTCAAKKIKKASVPTDRYRFWIMGATKTSPYQVQMRVTKGEETVEIVDDTNTDKLFSAQGLLVEGDGIYTLEIGRDSEDGNTAGNHAFSVKHECLSQDGMRTVTGKAKRLP